MTRARGALRSGLLVPCLLALIVLGGLALRAPSLTWGFAADDYGLVAMIDGEVEHPTMGPWSLYDFGELPSLDDPLRARFGPPWWTEAGWKVRFFRPVTSASLQLDHALWGLDARGFHADSLVLYALFLLACFWLFRALDLSAPVALGALAFLALDDAATVPVGWIANRNTLVEGLFTAASLAALASRARLGPGRAYGAAFVFAILALGSKESALAVPVLIALYLALLGKGLPVRERRLGIAAAAVLAAAYLAFFVLSGHGARCALYPTPWGEPLEWLRSLAVVLPASVLGLVSPAPLDALMADPRVVPAFVLLGLLVAFFLGRVIRRELGARPRTLFLLAWIAITLIPRVGAPPSNRILFVPAVASCALFAELVAAVLRSSGGRLPTWADLRSSALARWAVFLCISAGLLSGAASVPGGLAFERIATEARVAIRDADVGGAELGPRNVLMLQLPNALAGLQPQAVWRLEKGEADVRFTTLQYGRRGLRLTRTAPNALRIESLGSPFATDPFEWVFRVERAPIAAGTRYPGVWFDVTVLEPEGLGARSVLLELTRDLDEETVRLLTWSEGGMRALQPPAVGAELVLPAVVPPQPMWP